MLHYTDFRANENGGLLGKVEKEKKLLAKELVARIKVVITCMCNESFVLYILFETTDLGEVHLKTQNRSIIAIK